MDHLRLLRFKYQQRICENIVRIQKINNHEVPNFANRSNVNGIKVAMGIIDRLGFPKIFDDEALDEIVIDDQFERITKDFLEESFAFLRQTQDRKCLRDISNLVLDLTL